MSSDEDEYTTDAGGGIGFGDRPHRGLGFASAEINIGGRRQTKRMRWQQSYEPDDKTNGDDGDVEMEDEPRDGKKIGRGGLGFAKAGLGVGGGGEEIGGERISSGTSKPFMPIRFVSAGTFLPSSLDEKKKNNPPQQQQQQKQQQLPSNSKSETLDISSSTNSKKSAADAQNDHNVAKGKTNTATAATEFRRLVTGSTVEREVPAATRPNSQVLEESDTDRFGIGSGLGNKTTDADKHYGGVYTADTRSTSGIGFDENEENKKQKKKKKVTLSAWELSGTGAARKMMDKLGFDGTLGSKLNINAISRPIEVQTRPSQLGLGFGGFKEATHLNKELDKKDESKKARRDRKKKKKAAARRRRGGRGDRDIEMDESDRHWKANSDGSSESEDSDDSAGSAADGSDTDQRRHRKPKDDRRARREKRIYKTAAELAGQNISISSSLPSMVIIDRRAKTPRVLTNLEELAGSGSGRGGNLYSGSSSSGSDSDNSRGSSCSDNSSGRSSIASGNNRRSRNKFKPNERVIGRELVYNMGSLVQLAELELSGLGAKSAANDAEQSKFAKDKLESAQALAREQKGVIQLENVVALVEEAKRLVVSRCSGGRGMDQTTARELEELFASIRRMSGEQDYKRFRLGRLATALVGPALKDWAEHKWKPLDTNECTAGAEIILSCKRLLASQSDDPTSATNAQRLLTSASATSSSVWKSGADDNYSLSDLDDDDDEDGYYGHQRYATDINGQVVQASERVMAKVLRVSVLPRVLRALVSEWDVLKPDQALQLAAALRPVVGTSALLDLLRSSVLPRLVRAVSAWEPPLSSPSYDADGGDEVHDDATGSHHIHTWLQPWLSVLRPELEASYGTVRARLEEWMQSRMWSPAGPSGLMARNALLAWHSTWTTATIQRTCVRCVVPKLLKLVRAFEVNPADQMDMDVVDALIAWRSVIPPPHVVCIIVGELMPKWLDTMCLWLQSANSNGSVGGGVVKDVAAWYMGWKQRFPVDLQKEKSIVKCFSAGLRMLAKAKAGTSAITSADAATGSPLGYEALVAEHKRQYESTPPMEEGRNEEEPASLSHLLSQLDDVSIRESVEHFAEENGLSFMPHPKRTQDGVRVYRLGTINVLLHNNTIKVEERVRSSRSAGSATQWSLVTSMDDLRKRAIG